MLKVEFELQDLAKCLHTVGNTQLADKMVDLCIEVYKGREEANEEVFASLQSK